MQHTCLLIRRRVLGQGGMEPHRLRVLVDDEPPGASEETAHALDTLHAPWLRVLEWSHEHLVQAGHLRAILLAPPPAREHVAARHRPPLCRTLADFARVGVSRPPPTAHPLRVRDAAPPRIAVER